MFRRIWIAAIFISLIMTVYILRLAWLQLMPNSTSASIYSSTPGRGSWQKLSVAQRQRNLVLDTGRGDFYDRNGRPITGETYSAVAFFPVRPDARGSEKAISELSKLLGVSEDKLVQTWNHVKEPIFWKVNEDLLPMRLTEEQKKRIEALKLNGIRVLPYRNRYLQHSGARQVIGITSQHPEWLQANHSKELVSGKRKLTDQVGGSGLEKSLDKLLHGVGATSVSYFIDGRNGPLHGLDMRITQPNNRYYPLQVMTTLDMELQNRIEAYADKMGLQEGAIVVLDAHNADVVAMVSRPKLKPGKFQAADGSEWANHALKAAAPGSIFKLVTEAAALEAGVTNKRETFFCDGEYGKYGLSCWKEGGHGLLTLQEGLAQSCNIVFATIAERLKPSQLQRTADALGIGKQAGWHRERAFGPFTAPLRLLEEEEAGALFAPAGTAASGAGHGGSVESDGAGTAGNRASVERRGASDGAGAAESGGSVERRGASDGAGAAESGAERGGSEKRSRKQEQQRQLRERAAALAAVDGGVLAQSGIGQRDVRMSPLQAANLIVTLLNDGRVMEPRLVSEIRYANGQRMAELPAQRAQGSSGRIMPATARALQRGMEAVVDHGTGRSIRQGLWPVAGKSGTAETTRAGIARNHQWFAGYGPIKQPRYAIAVLVENQPPGSASQATKLFRGVMDIAASMDQKSLSH
ncbi:peptidoglycan D,D-transpeptidase FtsI family protein [Paenibacillus castaneae]